VDNLCGLFSAILRCRPCKAPALLRPSPCLAKNILAKYKSTFYQELVLKVLLNYPTAPESYQTRSYPNTVL
ncbi:MAG: hypothetical protein UH734_05920, partial [Ruminococcus sp.]|nr:hypothetical protein [Ruminococcus sp.]